MEGVTSSCLFFNMFFLLLLFFFFWRENKNSCTINTKSSYACLFLILRPACERSSMTSAYLACLSLIEFTSQMDKPMTLQLLAFFCKGKKGNCSCVCKAVERA